MERDFDNMFSHMLSHARRGEKRIENYEQEAWRRRQTDDGGWRAARHQSFLNKAIRFSLRRLH